MNLVEGFELRLRKDRVSADGTVHFMPMDDGGWRLWSGDARATQRLAGAGIDSGHVAPTRFPTLRSAIETATRVVGCEAGVRTSRCYLVNEPGEDTSWRVFWLRGEWRLYPDWTADEGSSTLTRMRFETRAEALRRLRIHRSSASPRSDGLRRSR